VCFVPTASGDSPVYVANFYRALAGHHDCEPSDLGLFERTVADLTQLAALPDGLGLLPGSCCPHYDGEEQWRPLYTRLVAEGTLAPGYAADDAAALVFEGTELREVVTTEEGSGAYRVTAEGEEALPARSL
jgi:hypothetical protein